MAVATSIIRDGGQRVVTQMSLPAGMRRIGSTNLEVDALGFGCASIGNLYHEVTDDEAQTLLEAAWSKGFRYFDTAPHYGQGLSERRLGDVLRKHQGDGYVLSTKVGRLLRPAGYAGMRHQYASPMPFDIHYDYSYSGVMRSFEDSLQRLGLDRIDILYVHDIGAYTHGDDNEELYSIAMTEGYKALDNLRSEGLVSAIGLGVNEHQVCEEAMNHGDWDCFLLAGRYTLLEQEALHTFLPKCVDRGCSVIIGGVYNSGILATGVSGKGPLHYDYGPPPTHVIEKVAKLESICKDFGIPLPGAALQFPFAHPAVACVLLGLGQAARLQQSLDLLALEIPPAFWEALQNESLLVDGTPFPTGPPLV